MSEEKKKEFKGLKRLRGTDDRKPEYHCDNCGCDRYSPCKCMKKGDKF